ncbi:MAG: hypothetical protein ACM3JI_02400, partial [Anaerolineae bacterium]
MLWSPFFRKISRFFSFIYLAASLFFYLDRYCHSFRHRDPDRFISDYPFNPSWKLPPLNEEETRKVEQILSQPFTYMTSGSQAYVFLSQDKHYVIKFFKHYKTRPKTWLVHLPVKANFLRTQWLIVQAKLFEAFESSLTAYKEMKEHTGMVFLQLNKTPGNRFKATLIDKKGKPHRIDLRNFQFLIQKKGELLYPRIARLMQNKQRDAAEQSVSAILNFVDFLGKSG